MADLPISFKKQLSSVELLYSYNNNVVEFSSSNFSGVTPAVKCEVTLGTGGSFRTATPSGDAYVVTPDNTGLFHFNFKEAFIKLLNQNNFEDLNILNVIIANTSSLIIEDSENAYISIPVTYKIFGKNGDTDTITKTYQVIKGVENIKNFTQRKINTSTYNFFWLSPFEETADKNIKVTYFVGYPFEVGYFAKLDGSHFVTNGANNVLVPFKKSVGKFVISDGLTTLGSFLPLVEGVNPLVVSSTPNITLEVTQKSGLCGEYVKWINKYGQWNYWLFNQKSKAELLTENEKPLFNDFLDLDDNISPVLEVGKKAMEVLTVHSGAVTLDEMLFLKGLFESPKVYLFITSPGEEMTDESFIEVRVKGQKTITKQYKGDTFNVLAKIELPIRNTMKL